jgi:hypothetical protein
MSAIPNAPSISSEEDEVMSSISVERKIKSPTELPCTSLSRVACGKNPSCEYSDENKVCIPKPLGESKQGTYEEYLLKSIRKWRENVVSWLDERKGACDLAQIMKNIYVYSSKDKSSASGTIIMRGLIMPTNADTVRGVESNVIIKTSYPTLEPFNNTLEVEKAIYENIITKLVNDRNTPGVISYLGNLVCDNDPKLPAREMNKYRREQQMIEDREEYDVNDAPSLLVLERSTGIQLKDFFTPETTAKDLAPIIFIVVYTLWCFANLGLKHNDLHFGNIFVEDVGKEITLFFRIGQDKIIKVKTRYIPKIYDFDRGSIRYFGVPRNIGLDMMYCEDYGTCNGINPKYDLYTFLWVLHNNLNNTSIALKNQVKINVLTKSLNWDWYADHIDSHLLKYGVVPTDAELKNHSAVLEYVYKADWGVPIFEELIPPAPIPKELVFTLPAKLKPSYNMIKPVKIGSSRAESKEFIDALALVPIDSDRQGLIIQLCSLWLEETKKDYGAPVNNIKEKIEEKITEKISETVRVNPVLTAWIQVCSLLLACYQIDELDDDRIKGMFGLRIYRLLSHIWNMFDNQLPVEIPVCKMVSIRS